MIIWRSDFEVGVSDIDSQHKGLVDLINKIEEARDSKGQEIDINSIVDQLIQYTHVHFASEKEHMAKNHYPQLDEHKQQHKVLVRQIIKIQSDIKNKNQNIIDSIDTILRNWLIDHILEQDRKYGTFLSSH